MILRALLASLLLALPAAAQSAGFRYTTFPNATGQGSTSIGARVYYPSTMLGVGTPLTPPPAGGYPVVVFLHGAGLIGNDYALLGVSLASEGYIVILHNTGRNSPIRQVNDATALFTGLQTINAVPGHYLEGTMDASRVGLAGHSVGGRSTITVLAAKVGYAAGICFAPALAAAGEANRVDVPLAIVHGTGDNVTPWQNNALGLFNNATRFTGSKVLYLFGAACDHTNLVGLGTGVVSQQIWSRSARVMAGFFDRYLDGDVAGLGEVVGRSARSEPRLQNIYASVEQPELWSVGTPTIGQTIRMELFAQAGPAGVMLAPAPGSLPTRFGLLELDPATLTNPLLGIPDASRLVTWDVTIPLFFNSGDTVYLQGFGTTNSGRVRFTESIAIVLE